MNKRTNKIQENYIIAKAALKAVQEVQIEKFKDFLSDKGLIEKDYAIYRNGIEVEYDEIEADYDLFAKAEIENTKLAWENLELAEMALIEFGISLAPANIKETIRNGVKKSLKNKEQLIDIALRLDARSVKNFKADLTTRLSA